MSTRTYRILCLSQAASPITHMARTEGNEAVVARQQVMTEHGRREVPGLSGNALRHRAVREPGMRFLVHAWGLAGELTLDQLNFMFHGGALTRGSGRENTRLIADHQRISPLGRLLGGCLPEQILDGSLLVSPGILICEENRERIGQLWGDAVDELPPLRPAESFVAGYQYTRGDARKHGIGLLRRDRAGTDGAVADVRPTSDGSAQGSFLGEPAEASSVAAPAAATDKSAKGKDSNLMIFSGQHVMPGSLFLHDFILRNVSRVELGALMWSLRLWQADGGTIGGQAARGHGRLCTAIVSDDADLDLDGACAAYLEHVATHRDQGAAWLVAAFAEPEVTGTSAKAKRSPASKK